ncbi:hypothetical protein GCM10027605_31000 [Micromonospora zhanjiangensis]
MAGKKSTRRRTQTQDREAAPRERWVSRENDNTWVFPAPVSAQTCREPLTGTLLDNPPQGSAETVQIGYDLDRDPVFAQESKTVETDPLPQLKGNYFAGRKYALKLGEQATFRLKLTVRVTCSAVAVVLAVASCSAGGAASRAMKRLTAPPPKDFRVTLLSEATKLAHGVAMSSDGRRAVTSSVDEYADPPHGSVSLWDLSDPLRPRAAALIPDRDGTALKVALSGDGRRAATFHRSGKLTLWDLADPARPVSRELPAKGVTSLALSHDGRYAISGGDDGVQFWDLADPGQVRKRQLQGSSEYDVRSYEVALSADAKRALVSDQAGDGGGGVTVYELADPANPEARPLIRNADHHSANTVALSGDGNVAVVGYHHWTTYNNFLTYWDLRTWDRTELRPMTGRKIAPDTMGSIVRWEVALDQEGKHVLLAQRNDSLPEDPSNPPPSTVQLWALDTLSGFPRFSLPN